MNVTGTSKIPVNLGALEGLLAAVKPDNAVATSDSYVVRLDARGNVRSTFAKLDSKKNTLNIYTGALASEWDTYFISSDGVYSDRDALIFVTCYAALAVFGGQASFDMGVDNMQTHRLDNKFEQVKNLLTSCVAKYDELAQQSPEAEVTPKDPKPNKASNSSSTKNEFAGQPLVEVPVLDIPSDLDI